MKSGERIPTPLKHRWRRFRYGAMPGICFIACVVLTLWLWRSQGRLPNAVGEVQAFSVAIAAGIDGRIEPRIPVDPNDPSDQGAKTWWTRFETVEEGDLIARLDSAPILAQLAGLKSDQIKLANEVEAERERLELDILNLTLSDPVNASRAQLDYIMEVERLRLEVVDRQTEIAANTIEARRLGTTLAYLQGLANKGVAVGMQVEDDTRLLRDETLARVEASGRALEEAREQLERANQRSKDLPRMLTIGPETINIETIVAPFKDAIKTQEALIAELDLQKEMLEIRAPFAGTISEVFFWPGQRVRAGDPIVTLARARGDGKQYVVSYLRQGQRIRPVEKMSVQLRMRMPGASAVAAKVDKVGSQYQLIPLRQLADPARPEYGLPVRILLPDEMKSIILPGELVDVRFER